MFIYRKQITKYFIKLSYQQRCFLHQLLYISVKNVYRSTSMYVEKYVILLLITHLQMNVHKSYYLDKYNVRNTNTILYIVI